MQAPGGDQDVAGVRGIAGLHPVDPRLLGEEVVPVYDVTNLRPASKRLRGGVHHPAKATIAHQHSREPGEVGRGRVIAGSVEPNRRGVVRPAKAERRGRSVHTLDERRHRAGDAVGERDGSVVAAREQQAVQQVVHGVALPWVEPEQRFPGDRVIGGRRHPTTERQDAEREVSGHQIRRRGDWKLAVRVVRGEPRPVIRVDQDPRAGVDRGGRGCRGRGLDADQRRRQRRRHGERRQPRPGPRPGAG